MTTVKKKQEQNSQHSYTFPKHKQIVFWWTIYNNNNRNIRTMKTWAICSGKVREIEFGNYTKCTWHVNPTHGLCYQWFYREQEKIRRNREKKFGDIVGGKKGPRRPKKNLGQILTQFLSRGNVSLGWLPRSPLPPCHKIAISDLISKIYKQKKFEKWKYSCSG